MTDQQQADEPTIPDCLCGNEARHWWAMDWSSHFIACTKCETRGPEKSNPDDALDAWTDMQAH